MNRWLKSQECQCLSHWYDSTRQNPHRESGIQTQICSYQGRCLATSQSRYRGELVFALKENGPHKPCFVYIYTAVIFWNTLCTSKKGSVERSFFFFFFFFLSKTTRLAWSYSCQKKSAMKLRNGKAREATQGTRAFMVNSSPPWIACATDNFTSPFINLTIKTVPF